MTETPIAGRNPQEEREVEPTEDSLPEWRNRPMEEVQPEGGHTTAELTHSERSSFYDGGCLVQAHITEVALPLERCAKHTFAEVQGGMESVGLLFEECIREVAHLESRRDELVQELLQLEQPMRRAVEALRAKLEEARRLLTLVQLDYMGLQEEARQVKRELFVTARDCIQSQVALAEQEYEVAQCTVTQEELQAHILSVTQEAAQLQEAQQNQLNTLRDRAKRPRRPRPLSDVTHCRRSSLDLQRRLSGSMRSLEGWYEPRLLALLRRMKNGEEALRRTREQGQDMRAQLGPLRDETQRLELQRACLEERIALMESDREESVAQYKETVDSLEDTISELNLELQVQKKASRDLEELKNGLSIELDSHRGCIAECETTAEGET